ncbi:hypothetical protein ABIF74_000243 [Bradyrhizobium japonicum]
MWMQSRPPRPLAPCEAPRDPSVHAQAGKGDPDDAVLEIRYRKIRVLPPIGKQTKYPALTLTVIHAQERGRPKRRKKIEWKLLTDLPVQSRKDAINKIEWYDFLEMEDRSLP